MRKYVWVLWLLLLLPVKVMAQRLGLVFGNNRYTQLDDLSKAANDAKAMLQELTKAGFRVLNKDAYKDMDRRAMLDARDELFNVLGAGDQVVVFYSGHGLQVGSDIYLLPVSFSRTVNTAERVAEESLALQSIMDGVRERIGTDGFAMYIVDACRNNPLSKSKRKGIANMLSRGLRPTYPPAGQLAIYAASNGQEALDALSDADSDPNGVFTRVLLKHLRVPGRPVMDVLADVQEEVVQLAKQVRDFETGKPHEQQPAVYNESKLKIPFCFYLRGGSCGTAEGSGGNVSSGDTAGVELAYWQAVDMQDPEQLRAYLSEYPRGKFAKLAQRKLKNLAQPVVVAKSNPIEAVEPVESGTTVVETAIPVSAATEQRLAFEPEMVDIPAGCFMMGSPESELRRSNDEGPQHRVCVKAFKIGKYEITFAEYDAFAVATGVTKPNDAGWGRGRRPVINVTWQDAVAYTQWLTQQTGKPYRLPSEAEWEYAARAGTTTPFWSGECISTDQANYNGNYAYGNCGSKTNTGVYRQQTLPVGSLAANSWGLYDVAGNVWEWTQDKWHDSYAGAPTDGSAWETGDSNRHMLRGGSWNAKPGGCRAANRYDNDNSYSHGFRVALPARAL